MAIDELDPHANLCLGENSEVKMQKMSSFVLVGSKSPFYHSQQITGIHNQKVPSKFGASHRHK